MMSCLQAIARIYRYGRTHATFVYRLLYKGTAEHRVYRRNVDKEGLFMKVVDKQTVKGDTQLHLMSCTALQKLCCLQCNSVKESWC